MGACYTFTDSSPQRATIEKINYHQFVVFLLYRVPQLKMDENYSYLFILTQTIVKSSCLNTQRLNGKTKLLAFLIPKKMFNYVRCRLPLPFVTKQFIFI